MYSATQLSRLQFENNLGISITDADKDKKTNNISTNTIDKNKIEDLGKSIADVEGAEDISTEIVNINRAETVNRNRIEDIGTDIANANKAKNSGTNIANINKVENLSIVHINKNNNLCKGKQLNKQDITNNIVYVSLFFYIEYFFMAFFFELETIGSFLIF